MNQVIDEGSATSSSTMLVHNATRSGEGAPLRLAHGMSATVTHAIERRLALLDELDTLAETRAELRRSAQLLGGHDNGERPTSVLSAGRDPRHRLSAAMSAIEQLERRFEELKRATNEARR